MDVLDFFMHLEMKNVLSDLFRACVFIFLFVGGVWFYLNFPSDLSIILIIANFVLAVVLTLKWEIQWALILFGLSLVYYLLFTLLPSSPCGSSHIKLGAATSCECRGVKKNSSLFELDSGMNYDRCVGKRIKCYNYDNSFSSSKAKEEVPCK